MINALKTYARLLTHYKRLKRVGRVKKNIIIKMSRVYK